MAEDDRREELERLRQVIAEQWPESARKQQVLSVLDEMVMESTQTSAHAATFSCDLIG
jgi:hypothetical protein